MIRSCPTTIRVIAPLPYDQILPQLKAVDAKDTTRQDPAREDAARDAVREDAAREDAAREDVKRMEAGREAAAASEVSPCPLSPQDSDDDDIPLSQLRTSLTPTDRPAMHTAPSNALSHTSLTPPPLPSTRAPTPVPGAPSPLPPRLSQDASEGLEVSRAKGGYPSALLDRLEVTNSRELARQFLIRRSKARDVMGWAV